MGESRNQQKDGTPFCDNSQNGKGLPKRERLHLRAPNTDNTTGPRPRLRGDNPRFRGGDVIPAKAGIAPAKAGAGTLSVLIVDNDPAGTRFMLEILARKGIGANLADDEKAAIDFLDKNSCDLAFVSEKLSLLQSSLDLISKVRSNSPELPVIMIAEPPASLVPRHSSLVTRQTMDDGRWTTDVLRLVAQAAVKAICMGCSDFLIKPLDHEEIESLLDTFLPNHSVCTVASAQEGSRYLYQIVGKSPKLIQIVNLAERIAPTSAPVLISGESGTGKELISFLIHRKSKRAQGPYIKVNCVALSDSLLESELFGHEKGAFTGAYTQRKGRFEMAHSGTLLLDEITETPLKFQAKLLRILEQQEFERVGGNENIRINVRIISTTNKDLLEEVQLGRFRQDLYYRLSGVRLVIPPLRQRHEDLPELVWHFVNLYARDTQRRITKLDPAMMDIFAKYHWPGNVRQLRNVVLTSLILGVGPTLCLADVSWLFDELQPLPQQDSSCVVRNASRDPALRESSCEETNTQYAIRNTQYDYGLGGIPLAQIERQAILDTLRQTAGNQTKAAKVLGISDRTLRDKIRRYRQSATGGHKARSQQECLQPVG
ncbi:MAG: sigma-54-dependent transcriptional regulator [Phycisphaerae bacterium]